MEMSAAAQPASGIQPAGYFAPAAVAATESASPIVAFPCVVSSFSPTRFFPPTHAATSMDVDADVSVSEDVAAIDKKVHDSLLHIGKNLVNEWMQPDISLLTGPLHSCKSRLLLQLAYNLASEAVEHKDKTGGSSSSSAAVYSDPFQPIILILPKRRTLEELGKLGSSNSGTKPITMLFGAKKLNPQILARIHIKWYSNEHDLLSIVRSLHEYHPLAQNNTLGVPPRFIGLLYDHQLSNEAVKVNLVMARFAEAMVGMQWRCKDKTSDAPAQGLFVISLDTSPRCLTLLPRYVRCVFEITQASSKKGLVWCLHSRPMLSLQSCSTSVLDGLITPMNELNTAVNLTFKPHLPSSTANMPESATRASLNAAAARAQAAAYPAITQEVQSFPCQIPMAPLLGIPVLQYEVNNESVQLSAILVAKTATPTTTASTSNAL